MAMPDQSPVSAQIKSAKFHIPQFILHPVLHLQSSQALKWQVPLGSSVDASLSLPDLASLGPKERSHRVTMQTVNEFPSRACQGFGEKEGGREEEQHPIMYEDAS